MPRTCTVCKHTEREQIDAALIAGESLRDIAGRFRVSKSALERHQADHLPETLTKAKEAQQVAHGDNLLAQVRELQQLTRGILARAVNVNDLRTAVAAIREAARLIELLGKLLGELDDRPQVNILVSAEWLTLRTMILNALTPYPNARQAVAQVLNEFASQ